MTPVGCRWAAASLVCVCFCSCADVPRPLLVVAAFVPIRHWWCGCALVVANDVRSSWWWLMLTKTFPLASPAGQPYERSQDNLLTSPCQRLHEHPLCIIGRHLSTKGVLSLVLIPVGVIAVRVKKLATVARLQATALG